MASPQVMTSSTLSALKGWIKDPGSNLDYVANLDPSVTATVVPGTVARLSATNTLVLGLGANFAMPLFVFTRSDSPDTGGYGDGGDPATDRGVWVGMNPNTKLLCLVATGGYELVTTNYEDDDYAPNDPLGADASGVDAGVLRQGVLGTDTICGVVSRGVLSNGYGYDALAFWSVFLPVYP